MEVQDLKVAKQQLEQKIFELIYHFNNDTGLMVSDINIIEVDLHATQQKTVVGVKVNVNL
jgi:hypothetical protein